MIGQIFTEDGALSVALKSLKRKSKMREPQRQYASLVDAAIKAKEPAFLDAETGVGKTLGYLVPTMLNAFADRDGRPLVLISTATIALQRQVLKDDIPVAAKVVADVLGFEPKSVIRVGREQVVDPDRLEAAISDFAVAEDREFARTILDWVTDKVDAGVIPLRADLMEQFAGDIVDPKPWLSSALIGLEDDTGDVGKLYDEMLDECDRADVLVINHHLLTLAMMRRFTWDAERPVYIVVDEADRLPGIVESMSRRILPLHQLSSTMGSFPTLEEARGEVDSLSEEVMQHFDNAWQNAAGGVSTASRLDHSEKLQLLSAMKKAEMALNNGLVKTLASRTVKRVEDREKLSYVEHARLELKGLMDELSSERGNMLLYFSPVRHYPGIASVNSGSSRLISSALWTKSPFPVRSLVFTSATLGTMASSSGEQDAKRAVMPFLGDCGFKFADIRAERCALIAPKVFGKMSFVRPPLDGPSAFVDDGEEGEGYKLRPEAISIWSDMVRAAAAEGGRVLVLVPSNRDLFAMRDSLADLGSRVIAQTPGFPTNAASRQFLDATDSVWISASAWEGVSLPGAISHIVIPRFPIRPAMLEDTLIERYFDERGAAAKGRSFVFGRRLAESRRRLRQGIGRGIRSNDDQVKIWIGDPRWPLTQEELDAEFADQPTSWSVTMLNAVPKRFRKLLERSPRFSFVSTVDDIAKSVSRQSVGG